MVKSSAPAPNPGIPPDDELELLRSLLINPEQSKLAKVEEHLYNPIRHAEDISQVIAEAILIRASRDNSLARALQPTLEEAIKTSVRNDPKFLADALFPVMGPAIRKAISESLRSMLQSMNQTLKYAFSWRGIKWRLEAIRTGKSFAEIVMLHTLVYRVEQVFLIHKDTGLLLAHASREGAGVKEAELVSPMLTAIQDFIRDSFDTGDAQALQTLHVGELSVWIEHGAQTILAETVTGEAPLALRTSMAETLERIEFEYGEMLRFFNGDNSSFKLLAPVLKSCLREERTEEGAKMVAAHGKPFNPAPLIFWVTVVCLALILFGLLASK